MGIEQHRRESTGSLGFAILTVSDTRDASSDRGGDYLVEAVEQAGHAVVLRSLCKDDRIAIENSVRAAVRIGDADLVLVTGGTGIAPRDVTYPTLTAMFESDIPGFGELFRWLSYDEVGSATILSRATAGILGGKIVIALPGSVKALQLAMQKIVLAEAGHMVSQLSTKRS